MQTLDGSPAFQLFHEGKPGGERFKAGSRENELTEFQDHANRVVRVQRTLAERSDKIFRRVFHAKSHGALLGEIRLKPDRPNQVRHGIFADTAPETYTVLARFSSGKGTIKRDLWPDVRGVALKIFGVKGAAATVDLPMTNSPVAFGRDHAEFIAFMESSMSFASQLAFFIGHRTVLARLLRSSLGRTKSVAALRYWTGHAYLLGPDQAMKMNLRPVLEPGARHPVRDAVRLIFDKNYYAHELAARSEQTEIRFVLSVQLQKGADLDATPVENTLIEWEEADSPSLEVADLVFERQRITDARREFVDTLSFDPWNHHPEHRPLGNLARGRLFSYAASREGRRTQTMPDLATFLEGWNARGQ
jgi:catalase